MPTLVTCYKVAASTLFLLGPVGLLWHKTVSSPLWGAEARVVPVFPDWLTSIAHGWYPVVLWGADQFFRRSVFSSAVYLAVCFLCVVAIFAAPFIRDTFLRVVVSLFLVAGVAYDLVMFDIGGSLPGLETTETVLSNIRFGFDGTVGAYTTKIIRNLSLAAAVLLGFLLPPPAVPRMPLAVKILPSVCVLMAVFGVMGILWRTSGYTSEFPSPVTSYINAYKSVAESGDQPIQDVNYPSTPHSPFRKIVLVMDESIRGDYISLNDAKNGATPYLAAHSADIANFGVATSAANCSTASRVAMRFGVRERDLGTPWKTLRRQPSIWQYAERAGFKTIHVDTFGDGLTLVNGMTATERSLIDERIVIQDTPVYRRDEDAAGVLRKLLQAPGPAFILVDKYGTHIPYDRMYPPSANVFDASRSSFSLENKSELIKHYKNAIAWSVDGFFAKLLEGGLPPDTLLVYTSDHGQSLSETPTKVSHCSPGASVVKGEVLVPLFALTNNPDWKTALGAAAKSNFGLTTHFEVFPTLLLAMGYEREHMSGLSDGLLGKLAHDRPRHFYAAGDQKVYEVR